MLYLPSYVFPEAETSITNNIVLGTSLGGHATWLSLLHEPSVTAAVIIIGCPDYLRLMSHRAAKSKRPSWIDTSPQGIAFVGSKDFPGALVAAVKKYDPAGLLMGQLDGGDHLHQPSDKEIQKLRPIMHDHLAGKKILNLSGGADKLVPYSCAEPFITFLSRAIEKDTGWFADGGVELTNKVFEGVGHEMTEEMLLEAVEFVAGVLTAAPSNRDPALKRDYPKI
jgi:pimeloyl-ACP methyl ester carboxylesterase